MSSVLESRPTGSVGRPSGGRSGFGKDDPESARPAQLTQLEVVDDDTAATTGAGAGADGATSQPDPDRVYITGWRLYVVSFSLCLSLLLSTLETTIVSTSLVSITNALGGFDQRDWVVTSYLLTYTGFLVIYAKFSDILGRKFMLLSAVALFTVFSIVCGSISSILQLIIFRAFQGVGASGIYAMATVMNPELVPPEKWGTYVGIISIVFVLSSVLGPILGGAINDNASWRWVFLLNAPAGAIATALIAFILPTHFPHQGNPERQLRLREKFSRASLARLDVVGALLLLAASILLVFGFEEAGSRYPWSSPAVVATLALGGVLFVAFVGWEKVIEGVRFVQEPIFPLRLMKNRQFVGITIIGFLTGPPFMTVLINLPQRFQAVNGSSPFEAGIHLLPLLLCSPVATALAGQLVSRLNVPPFYLMLAGASLQVLGVGLASSAGVGDDRNMYGYEIIMGFAFGMSLITLLIYVPLAVDRADMAVAMGSVTQIRVLGGTIGLAIASTVLNGFLSPRLAALLTPAEMQRISDSVQTIDDLPEATREAVRRVFCDAYNEQLRVVLYFSAAAWLSTLLLWERKLKRAKDIKGY